MWAFGVLFYFMLNMEFPFSTSMQNILGINPHLQLEQKRE